MSEPVNQNKATMAVRNLCNGILERLKANKAKLFEENKENYFKLELKGSEVECILSKNKNSIEIIVIGINKLIED